MAGPRIPPALRAVVEAQCGVVSGRQCEEQGVTVGRRRHLVASGHWQRLHRGVFVTYTGRLTDESRVVAALLAVGGDAAASHETSLWLADRKGWLGPLVHVGISRQRNVAVPAGVRVHHITRLLTVGDPRRVITEAALLDVVDGKTTAAEVVHLVCRMVGGRRTTPERLAALLGERRAHAWRGLLIEMLADVAVGAQSPLELRDLDNDRAHGLPAGQRQVYHRAGGEGRWLDVVVRGPATVGVVVKELDGRLGHEAAGRFRDMRRDNASTVGGGRPLRFGWADETDQPCETAALQMLLWRRLGAGRVGRSCRRPDCRPEARLTRLHRDYPLLARR